MNNQWCDISKKKKIKRQKIQMGTLKISSKKNPDEMIDNYKTLHTKIIFDNELCNMVIKLIYRAYGHQNAVF